MYYIYLPMYYTIHYPNNTFSSKKVMPNMQNNYFKKFFFKANDLY